MPSYYDMIFFTKNFLQTIIRNILKKWPKSDSKIRFKGKTEKIKFIFIISLISSHISYHHISVNSAFLHIFCFTFRIDALIYLKGAGGGEALKKALALCGCRIFKIQFYMLHGA